MKTTMEKAIKAVKYAEASVKVADKIRQEAKKAGDGSEEVALLLLQIALSSLQEACAAAAAAWAAEWIKSVDVCALAEPYYEDPKMKPAGQDQSLVGDAKAWGEARALSVMAMEDAKKAEKEALKRAKKAQKIEAEWQAKKAKK